MTELFNNREIATGIWLMIAIFFGSRNKGIRESCTKVLRWFCHWKIIVRVLLMMLHVGLSVLLLYRLGLWNVSLLKDTIYWFLFAGFVLFMNLMTGKDDRTFFRKTILDCFKVMVLIQFLLNFYPLPLPVELVMVPVLVFLGAMAALAAIRPEFAPAKKVLDGVLAIIGFAVLAHVGRSIYLQYAGLLRMDVLRSLLLPMWLTFLFLPFLYVAKLIADYEMLFVRLPYLLNKNEELVAYVKRRALMTCHLDLRKLSRFSKDFLISLNPGEDRQSVDQWFRDFQSGAVCGAEERE